MRADVSNKTGVGFVARRSEGGAEAVFQVGQVGETIAVFFYVDQVDEDEQGMFVVIGDTTLRIPELLKALQDGDMVNLYHRTLQINDEEGARSIGVKTSVV